MGKIHVLEENSAHDSSTLTLARYTVKIGTTVIMLYSLRRYTVDKKYSPTGAAGERISVIYLGDKEEIG